MGSEIPASLSLVLREARSVCMHTQQEKAGVLCWCPALMIRACGVYLRLWGHLCTASCASAGLCAGVHMRSSTAAALYSTRWSNTHLKIYRTIQTHGTCCTGRSWTTIFSLCAFSSEWYPKELFLNLDHKEMGVEDKTRRIFLGW